ncbi:hypothetical protein Hdeb2414_s0009g00323211 [Helianthus debilis subsp. tardiflorus]
MTPWTTFCLLRCKASEFNLVHQGGETVNLDYFSVDGVSDDELHIDEVVKQMEELQHLEVNLKARLIARSEVTGIHERVCGSVLV